MTNVSDIQNERRSERERGRLAAPGKRTDDGSVCTLLVIHENDGACPVNAIWLTSDDGHLRKDAVHLLAADEAVAEVLSLRDLHRGVRGAG